MVSSQVVKVHAPVHFVPGVNVRAYLALNTVLVYGSVLPVKLLPKSVQLSGDTLDSIP